MSSSTKARKTPKRWENDGVDGNPSSIDIILDWITTGTNYERWKGGGRHGVTKQILCGEIVGRMKEVGIYHRNSADIRTKIFSLQTTYNKARDWIENTGEGIQGNSSEAEMTIQDALKSRCKYWDILHPVFSNRASSRPLFLADNLGNEDVAGDLLGQEKRVKQGNKDDNNDNHISSAQITHDSERKRQVVPMPDKTGHDTANSQFPFRRRSSRQSWAWNSDSDREDSNVGDKEDSNTNDREDSNVGDREDSNAGDIEDREDNIVPAMSKGKRPMKLRAHQKPQKPSLGEAFLMGNKAKDEIKRLSLDFAKRKWSDEMEEKASKLKLEVTSKKWERTLTKKKLKIEEVRVKTEKNLAKTAMMKTLKDLGMPMEDILEQVKDF